MAANWPPIQPRKAVSKSSAQKQSALDDRNQLTKLAPHKRQKRIAPLPVTSGATSAACSWCANPEGPFGVLLPFLPAVWGLLLALVSSRPAPARESLFGPLGCPS